MRELKIVKIVVVLSNGEKIQLSRKDVRSKEAGMDVIVDWWKSVVKDWFDGLAG